MNWRPCQWSTPFEHRYPSSPICPYTTSFFECSYIHESHLDLYKPLRISRSRTVLAMPALGTFYWDAQLCCKPKAFETLLEFRRHDRQHQANNFCWFIIMLIISNHLLFKGVRSWSEVAEEEEEKEGCFFSFDIYKMKV